MYIRTYKQATKNFIDSAFVIHYFWQPYEASKVCATQEQKKLLPVLLEAKITLYKRKRLHTYSNIVMLKGRTTDYTYTI